VRPAHFTKLAGKDLGELLPLLSGLTRFQKQCWALLAHGLYALEELLQESATLIH
jgi:hypothetical protein